VYDMFLFEYDLLVRDGIISHIYSNDNIYDMSIERMTYLYFENNFASMVV
jgi:hypothetical protein